ncbi:unnamed protein product [Gongylonema pulchrum]|uniref:Protein-serine/threonine phosphatase n=1 Tax=Gongylonema pulchrum TaxID=637853 RepID=A0A183EUC6_9BILA|nr:unnamed protein product [Gongylonema pulchrum]
MQTVDLDEVTSRDIRLKVEESLGMNLDEYKDFISRQVMVIMGQMDTASQIFPYLYLGTEWNACDWQWLENNNLVLGYFLNISIAICSVKYIVNVTNEEYGWALSEAMEHVKNKRDCITPNLGFVEQLRTFEGMLHAFKKRDQFDVSPSTSSTESSDSLRSRNKDEKSTACADDAVLLRNPFKI